jgi:hypothetical protein
MTGAVAQSGWTTRTTVRAKNSAVIPLVTCSFGLLRTDGAGLHPGVKERARSRLRAGRWLAVPSRSPGPADQMILTHMMHDVLERSAAIARRIFELLANLRERLAFPSHLMRRELPGRIARHSGGFEISRLVTDRTAQRRKAKAILAARDRRLMQTSAVALARAIAGRMAVHAARMGKHFGGFGEQGRRARCGLGDCAKAFRRPQTFSRRVRGGMRGNQHRQQRSDRQHSCCSPLRFHDGAR